MPILTNRMELTPITLTPAERRLASRNLKVCPVCRSLNATRNAECFVCSWSGAFDSDSDSIEEGLQRLLARGSYMENE